MTKEQLEYQRQYRIRNRERLRANQQKYREMFPDKVKECKSRSHRKHRDKHKEKVAEYGRKWHSTNRERRLTYQVRHRRRNTLKAIELMGGCKCQACGLVDDPVVYDFHHVDPKKKVFEISHFIGRDNWWDAIVEELKKCILLCCICHRKLHAKLIKITPQESLELQDSCQISTHRDGQSPSSTMT